jgi:hypothetical protein
MERVWVTANSYLVLLHQNVLPWLSATYPDGYCHFPSEFLKVNIVAY